MMKTGETRTYTIPLRKEFLKTPKWRRAEKAVSTVRSFVTQHSKSEEVKIGRWLNEAIWHRGAKNPPSRVRVEVKKEELIASVELSELPRQAKKLQAKETPAELPKKVEKKESKPKTEKKKTKPKQTKPASKKESKTSNVKTNKKTNNKSAKPIPSKQKTSKTKKKK